MYTHIQVSKMRHITYAHLRARPGMQQVHTRSRTQTWSQVCRLARSQLQTRSQACGRIQTISLVTFSRVNETTWFVHPTELVSMYCRWSIPCTAVQRQSLCWLRKTSPLSTALFARGALASTLLHKRFWWASLPLLRMTLKNFAPSSRSPLLSDAIFRFAFDRPDGWVWRSLQSIWSCCYSWQHPRPWAFSRQQHCTLSGALTRGACGAEPRSLPVLSLLNA